MSNTYGCGRSGLAIFLKVLLIIGGLNWGLVGIGYFAGSNLNVVNLVLGGAPVIEAIVYLIVGVAAFVSIFGCRCRKCRSAAAPANGMGGSAPSAM